MKKQKTSAAALSQETAMEPLHSSSPAPIALSDSDQRSSHLIVDANEVIDALLTAASNEPIHSCSIRVLSPLTVKYSLPGSGESSSSSQTTSQFVSATSLQTDTLPITDAHCYLRYKRTATCEPTTAVFVYSDRNARLVSDVVEHLSKSIHYTAETDSPSAQPFTWFFRGNLYNSYPSINAMFFQAFATGNLKLEKRDYTNPSEGYTLSISVGSRFFKSYQMFHSWEFKHAPKTEADAAASSAPKLKPSMSLTDCVICLDAKADHLLNPCGHICLCSDCSDIMSKAAKKNRICPICRGKFVTSIRIFFA